MMAEPGTENERENINELEERGEETVESSVKMGRSRKDKRKETKKMKRKLLRREAAEMEREADEARFNDPAVQEKLEREEAEEQAERERTLKEFEERERAWIESMEKKKKADEEEEENRRMILEEASRKQKESGSDCDNGDAWEYVEEGPAEIIWQGNEIIFRKKKVKVPKKETSQMYKEEDADRPTSNPLPPQSEAFADYLDASSAQKLLENVAKEVPNFGTEQDKAHCPFHLKTGACRFGDRCSRVHFHPDKSCTLLIRNMYNGPGIAWDQDEGLEQTDEEIERCYEEFYDDVHTEFLKFGEIVNFKVCRNGSFHLRGNVYVHYKTLEFAISAYHAINGRYFAGKQIQCEFVNVTRWKVAICGEFLKSRFKTCSHGSACNFIHCFRNPGGDYEWADWDKQPPRYWVKRMAVLFGYSDESAFGEQMESEHLGSTRNSSKMTVLRSGSHRSRRSRSMEIDQMVSRARKSSDDEDDLRDTAYEMRHKNRDRKQKTSDGRLVESQKVGHHHLKVRSCDNDGMLAMNTEKGDDNDQVGHEHGRKRSKSKHHKEVSDYSLRYRDFKRTVCEDDLSKDSEYDDGDSQMRNERTRKRSKHRNIDKDSGKRTRESGREVHRCHSHRQRVGSPSNEGSGNKRTHDTVFIEMQSFKDIASGRKHHHRRKRSSEYQDKFEECSDDHEDTDYHDGDHSDGRLERNRSHHYHKREHSRHVNEVSELLDDLEHHEKKLKGKSDSKRYSHSSGSHHACTETSKGRRYRLSELDCQQDKRENSSSLDHWQPAALEEISEDDFDGLD